MQRSIITLALTVCVAEAAWTKLTNTKGQDGACAVSIMSSLDQVRQMSDRVDVVCFEGFGKRRKHALLKEGYPWAEGPLRGPDVYR